MNDMMSDEQLQRQRACACVDMRAWASRFLNGSHSVLRVMYHATCNRVSSRMLLRVSHVWSRVSVCGDDDDHDDYNTCIVEGGCM
jgi:hypothetical protein